MKSIKKFVEMDASTAANVDLGTLPTFNATNHVVSVREVLDADGKATGKTMLCIPVVYEDAEAGEVTVAGRTSDDIVAAYNAGARLAAGDLAKSPYKKQGGQKLVLTAMRWLMTQPELAKQALTIVDPIEQDKFILDAFNSR